MRKLCGGKPSHRDTDLHRQPFHEFVKYGMGHTGNWTYEGIAPDDWEDFHVPGPVFDGYRGDWDDGAVFGTAAVGAGFVSFRYLDWLRPFSLAASSTPPESSANAPEIQHAKPTARQATMMVEGFMGRLRILEQLCDTQAKSKIF